MYSVFRKATDIKRTDPSMEIPGALQLRLHTSESRVDFQPVALGSLPSISLDNKLAGFLCLRTTPCQAVLSLMLPRKRVDEAVSGYPSSRLANRLKLL